MERRREQVLGLLWWAAMAGVSWLVLRYALVWLLPFLLALGAAALLEPLIVRAQRRLHLRRSFTAAVLTLVLVGGVLAALIALIDALPVFGTGTVLVPWAAVECLLGAVPRGIALLALFAVISVVRSVLEPKLMAAQAGLPPLASLCAMYVGFCAMGVAGMVLAPMALMLVKQLRDGGYIRLWR